METTVVSVHVRKVHDGAEQYFRLLPVRSPDRKTWSCGVRAASPGTTASPRIAGRTSSARAAWTGS